MAGLAFYGSLFWRALRTFRLTHRQADLLVAVGIAWLAAALPAALLLGYWNLGWWLGHAFEIVGIAAVGIPVALDLRRGTARSRPLLGDLKGADLVEEEEAFLGSHVALAEKDGYTEEHTRRVALRAVQVGDELGLAPERLRDLAVGGLLHDIGKLSVPDEVLKKPGPLTDGEFALVKRHVDTRCGAPPRPRRVLGRRPPPRSQPPRAARRIRVSGGGAGRRDPARRPDSRGVRRVRRAALDACLPRGLVARARDRDERLAVAV